jgi:hypothetical protein
MSRNKSRGEIMNKEQRSYLEDLLAALDVGQADVDLPVEAPGSQYGLVQDVCTVGAREHNDPLSRREAVHLHQQLVQRVLTDTDTTAQHRHTHDDANA